MNDKIEIGSIVQLRSGGPRMTVDIIDQTKDGVERVTCVWFGTGMTNSINVDMRTLKLIQPERE